MTDSGVSDHPKVGHSIKKKQEQLYNLCYDYLNDNFHKFTDANKLKVSLALATKMAPSNVEGERVGGDTKVIIIKDSNGNQNQDGTISRPISLLRV